MPQVALQELVAAVQAGELVSFPTDTVPALAARPEAGDRIYTAKERSPDKPLILMGASLDDLRPYVDGTEDELAQWSAIAAQYWPGALTLVLPASDRLPPAMNPQQTGTVGLRIPNHPLARHLLGYTGPLATTSANRSGQPPLETMTAIEASFPQVFTLDHATQAEIYAFLQAEVPLPDQPQGSGLPSTVVRWQEGGWTVLRSGAVALPKVETA
ncbi:MULTISPECIES: L-threonylcarbamoyladenylate synthase [Cyanophyceae]|uniref:L-threonylcarbamoyladenylate synthase n=1 Tax=Leptolyngbya subtilissima DQ-A4 TaxID=2933933 RepID=A0ABV0K9Q6_9CYAN|nr:L-threonylcarbamoyladenylate synthase [Nodosilinea sp. FACHB-141]MBD2114210.1 L-threonylcarbamoyladenylate synthase [Nodosilinea sp. FACHB-141]